MSEPKRTPHGFTFGAADVTCLFSDDRKQTSTVGIRTPKVDLQVYVTKTGIVHIHDKNGEWQKPAKREEAGEQ